MNTSTVDTRHIPRRWIGTSCPWKVVAPADMTKTARDLETARTHPWMRELLAKQAGSTVASPEPPTPVAPEVVVWGGRVVDAPGFSQDQFERAMMRAFADDLQVKATSQHEHFVVHHAGTTHGYRVTRERCSCKAGEVGTPCKHRAAVIAHLDIREPHIDREWRKLMADRPAAVSA